MNVLLSIKPKYVERVIGGNKRYEFRKSMFKKHVDEVWVYATSPIKKIIGTFVVDEVIQDTPKNLWINLDGSSGMSEEEFFNFFKGKQMGFAIKIESLKMFKNCLDPKMVFPNFVPPRSFYYFDSTLPKVREIKQKCAMYNLAHLQT